MNIFAVDNSPMASAMCLPDKHVLKMPVETSQMLAVCLGYEHGLGLGRIRKRDGEFYSQSAFRNHPCTVWARASHANLAWLIVHGQMLCVEFMHRYGKRHSCMTALGDASHLFGQTGYGLGIYCCHDEFARAMPEDLKSDTTIDSITAYRRYLIREKKWAKWCRDPRRKPEWWNDQV